MWMGIDFYNYQATEIKKREDIPQNSETPFPPSQGHHHVVTAGRHALLQGRENKN